MFSFITKLLMGTGMSSIENIASEWIQTDMEKAEAQTLMLKTLDPNGLMRRQISQKVGELYSLYIVTTLLLLIIEFICALFALDINNDAIATATVKVTDLFVPISSLFGIIVGASFGVNYANVKQNN